MRIDTVVKKDPPFEPLDAGRGKKRRIRRENRPFAAAHHLGSMPLECGDPFAIYLACEVLLAGEIARIFRLG